MSARVTLSRSTPMTRAGRIWCVWNMPSAVRPQHALAFG